MARVERHHRPAGVGGHARELTQERRLAHATWAMHVQHGWRMVRGQGGAKQGAFLRAPDEPGPVRQRQPVGDPPRLLRRVVLGSHCRCLLADRAKPASLNLPRHHDRTVISAAPGPPAPAPHLEMTVTACVNGTSNGCTRSRGQDK